MNPLDATTELFQQYRKEIILIVLTGVTTFIFTKALPTLLIGVKQGVGYLFAICTGRGKEHLFLRRYLKWILNENRYLAAIPSQVLDPERLPQMPELEDVYITLRLRGSGETSIDLPPSYLITSGAKTVVLGDPGAGKTTLLKYLCLTHARFGIASALDWKKRRELRERIGARLGRVPILIPLNRMYRDSTKPSSGLLSLARESLPESLRGKCPSSFFERLLEQGHTLMLLDGLDEVASYDLRVRASEEIAALANASHRDNAWIVTSRIVGYKPKLQEHGFRIATVEQLTMAQSNRFILHWYTVKCESTGYVGEELDYERQRHKERAQHLVDALNSNPGLRSLATSPMLLSLIALLHSVRLELPENRAVLYRDCVELLADRWDLYRGLRGREESLTITTAQKVGLLVTLGWRMHNDKRRETSQHEVEELVNEYLSMIAPGIDLRASSEFVNSLQERSALMISRGTSPSGDRVLTFSHLSFQEYLVSRRLHDLPVADGTAFVLDHWADPWWKEAILLYMAQFVSPLELVGNIYNRARQEVILDGLLFVASCLAELQTSKSEAVFHSVMNDLAFIVSCGRVGYVLPERLRSDRWNLVLRYLVATVQELSQRRSATVSMLFRVKLDLSVEVAAIAQELLAASSTNELALFDRDAVRFCLTRLELSSEDTLRLVGRFPDVTHSAGVSLRSVHTSPITSLEGWNWPEILNACSVLPGPFEIRSVVDEQRSWKDDLVSRSALGLQVNARQHVSEDLPEYVEAGQSILDALEGNDYIVALHRVHENLVRYGKVGLDVRRVNEVYFKTQNDEMRTLIVTAALNRCEDSDELMGVFLDFIRQTVSARETSAPGSASAHAGQEYVALRCLESIRSEQVGSRAFVNLLLDCLTTRAHEFQEVACRKLFEIKLADPESVQQCMKIAALGDGRQVWGAILALGGAGKFFDDDVIRRLLPWLYERDYTFQGATLRTVAARSLIQLVAGAGTPEFHASN